MREIRSGRFAAGLRLCHSTLAVPRRRVDRSHLGFITMKLARKVRELEESRTALRESEARFRSFAESSPIGMVSLDLEGHSTYASQRVREMSGLPARGPMERVWSDVVHPDDRASADEDVKRALSTGVEYERNVRLVRPDGQIRWVHIRGAPVRDDGGQPAGLVVTMEDVTELREALARQQETQDRLRASERLDGLGQLAAGIAHDFNNILAIMINYAHFVRRNLDRQDTHLSPQDTAALVRADLSEIIKAGERAAALTHQLLMFGRSQAINPEVIDLNRIVADAERLLTRTIGENIELTTDLAAGLWPVLAQTSRLEQVIVNLVVNARDAIPGTGTIAISTENIDIDEAGSAQHPGSSAGRYARITIADTGTGMAPEVMAHAFDPFFTTKAPGRGTGLGLATTHGIVRQLEGFIELSSECGKGTVVRINLPVTTAVSPVDPILDTQTDDGHGETILIVEDDADVRSVATRILTDAGYVVLGAARAPEALEMLDDPARHVALIVSDVIMPEMSGADLANRVDEHHPHVGVLFMSGYAKGLITPGADQTRDFSLVDKPFNRESLLTAVKASLELKRRQP